MTELTAHIGQRRVGRRRGLLLWATLSMLMQVQHPRDINRVPGPPGAHGAAYGPATQRASAHRAVQCRAMLSCCRFLAAARSLRWWNHCPRGLHFCVGPCQWLMCNPDRYG